MHNNQVFSESVTENNRPRKWWYRRWVKIIGICFIVLSILAITLSLVLKLVIITPKKPQTTTVTTTPPPLTTTTTTTTIQQSGEL
jgi:hypothetical protein